MDSKRQQIEKLIELNDELKNYFQNTIIPQLFVDAHLVLRKFTPPSMKQFNLKLEDVGRPMEDIKDNFRFPSIIDNIQQVITSGEVLEKEIQTTDLRWYQINILPYLVAKKNKTDGVIITFVEITRRIKDLTEQEKLVAEHEVLLDTISHDIKTPLANLGLTIELLRKIPENGMEKFPMFLDKLENSLVNMKEIIKDLTETRQLKYQYKTEEELLDIEYLVEDARLALAQQIMDSGAIIKCDIHQSEVFFVRRKLRSVIYNLVSNAIKYKSAERKPEIYIKVVKEGEFTIITVRDNGRGIAAGDAEKVFEKYERISKDVEGAGIGLYLVREIVTLAGGKITVESEIEKGSVFTIYLYNHN